MLTYELNLEELVQRGLRAEALRPKRNMPWQCRQELVPVGGGDHVSVLIRDRLEEAGQGQEAASSEEASSLVVQS